MNIYEYFKPLLSTAGAQSASCYSMQTLRGADLDSFPLEEAG